MKHELPELPYAPGALAPVLSEETIEFHHGKHHRAYVDNLNRLVAGTAHEASTLEEIVRSTHDRPGDRALFNNAAQAWNHGFYWRSLSPQGGGAPRGRLAAAIDAAFDGFAAFRSKFAAAAVAHFGSGWIWLVETPGGLAIEATANAATPFAVGRKCLLTLDVWEHAYYIDYRNARPRYVERFWDVVDWSFAESNLKAP
jgi:Fe-Mn family superoxide dismutase